MRTYAENVVLGGSFERFTAEGLDGYFYTRLLLRRSAVVRRTYKHGIVHPRLRREEPHALVAATVFADCAGICWIHCRRLTPSMKETGIPLSRLCVRWRRCSCGENNTIGGTSTSSASRMSYHILLAWPSNRRYPVPSRCSSFRV